MNNEKAEVARQVEGVRVVVDAGCSTDCALSRTYEANPRRDLAVFQYTPAHP
jgi:hypothetical protein